MRVRPASLCRASVRRALLAPWSLSAPPRKPAKRRQVVSPPASVPTRTPAPAAIPKAGRIDLSAAPSGMEHAAEGWRGDAVDLLSPVPVDDGKAFCGPCDARVPQWFGAGCIAGDCPLREGA